ncbi:MAG: UDP binding domain-containing protein, partial [Gammaproteobacteria bacterium]|nr:UDP binding domain-containing protein [Gammaproteobacteria bacterium]
EIILAGRRMNDGMGKMVANEVMSLMTKKRIPVVDSNILIMGLTFKENCPDLRNTRVVDVIRELEEFHCNIDVYDPWIDKEESQGEYGITPVNAPEQGRYDAVILAVSHKQFKAMGVAAIRKLGKESHILYDIKYIFPAEQVDGRL